MSYRLHLSKDRNALKPRREPYWGAPLARGQYVGLRKINADTSTWIARYRDDELRQNYKSLGIVSATFDFDQAKAKAEEWIKLLAAGVKPSDVTTVADACRRYVEERKASKSAACSHDAEKRFERTVYEATFGKKLLAKLRVVHVREWRDSLG